MKKKLLFLIVIWLMVMVMPACSKGKRKYEEIAVGDSYKIVREVYKERHVSVGGGAITVYKDKHDYVVVILHYNYDVRVKDVIVFSQDRELLYSLKNNYIESMDFSKYYGKSTNELQEELGLWFEPLSNPPFIVAYVTDNAEIVILHTEGTVLENTVRSIQLLDIITGETTEISP